MSNLAVDFARRHARALGASIALTIGFAWVLRRGALPLLPPEGTLEHVNAGLIALGAACLLVNTLLRFTRCYLLLAPIAEVKLRNVLVALFISYGLITLLPFRLGELARPALLREKGKLSGWAITGSVGAERIIDGVMTGLILLSGLAFAVPQDPLPDHIGDLPVAAAMVPRAARLATLGFVGIFLVMTTFFVLREKARRVTEAVIGVFSRRLATSVAEAVIRVSDGLRFLPKWRYTAPYLAMTLAAFGVNILGVQLIARGAGMPPLTYAQATVVLGVLALGFAVPNAPGFFGQIQIALYAGLAVYVPPERVVHEGAAFVFLFYLVYLAQVAVVTLCGLSAEYWSPETIEERSDAH